MILIIPTKSISNNLAVTGERIDDLLAPYIIFLGELKSWNEGAKHSEFP